MVAAVVPLDAAAAAELVLPQQVQPAYQELTWRRQLQAPVPLPDLALLPDALAAAGPGKGGQPLLQPAARPAAAGRQVAAAWEQLWLLWPGRERQLAVHVAAATGAVQPLAGSHVAADPAAVLRASVQPAPVRPSLQLPVQMLLRMRRVVQAAGRCVPLRQQRLSAPLLTARCLPAAASCQRPLAPPQQPGHCPPWLGQLHVVAVMGQLGVWRAARGSRCQELHCHDCAFYWLPPVL